MSSRALSSALTPFQQAAIARALPSRGAPGVLFNSIVAIEGRRFAVTAARPLGQGDWERALWAVVARRANARVDRLLPVVATGCHDGYHWVAYETGRARPLVADGWRRWPARLALDLVSDVANALDDAAAFGIVPYELPPSSIFMDARLGPLLGDLGAAREVVGSPPAGDDPNRAFTPPDVIAGGVAGARSGVYVCGALLYAMLSGGPPRLDPLTRWRSDVPREIEPVLARAMADDTLERYRTAAEFCESAERALGLAPDTPAAEPATAPYAGPTAPPLAPADPPAPLAPAEPAAPFTRAEPQPLTEPDAFQPQAREPEGFKPSASDPAFRPLEPGPQAFTPSTPEPDAFRSHAPEPDVVEPLAPEPKGFNPSASEPAFRPLEPGPQTFKPPPPEPDAVELHGTEPEAFRPHAPEPEVVEPRAPEADVVEQVAPEVDALRPLATEPDGFESLATEPDGFELAPEPEFFEPLAPEPDEAVTREVSAPTADERAFDGEFAPAAGPAFQPAGDPVFQALPDSPDDYEWAPLSPWARRLRLVLAVGVVAAAAAVGFQVAQPDPPDRVSGFEVTAPGLDITLPAGWNVGETRGRELVAAYPTSDWLAGLTIRTGEKGAAVQTGSDPVRLGNVDMWRDTSGAPRVVRYVLPTSAGSLQISCEATSDTAQATLAACERSLSTLSLDEAKPLRLAGVVRKPGLRAALEQLRRARIAGRAALARARTPRAQRAAALRLERANSRAAKRLEKVPDTDSLAASVTRAAGAYRTLAGLAGSGNRAAWSKAATRVRSAEAALADELAKQG